MFPRPFPESHYPLNASSNCFGVTIFFICHLIYMFLKTESLFFTLFQFSRHSHFYKIVWLFPSSSWWFEIPSTLMSFSAPSHPPLTIPFWARILSLEQTHGFLTPNSCTTPSPNTPSHHFFSASLLMSVLSSLPRFLISYIHWWFLISPE